MEISEIKQKLQIETILKHYSLQPDKNNMLVCPFHKEKEPSLKIYPQINTFHCFGCGKNGDVIEFIQLKEASTGSACSKHQAMIKAQSMISTTSVENKEPPKPKANNTDNQAIIEKIFTLFKKGIHINFARKPKEYLQKKWPMKNLGNISSLCF